MSTALPPIYRDCRRLLVHTEEVVRRFSRYHKYTVGADLRQQAMALMRGVHRAVYERARQAAHVQALVWQVDDYKLTLQLAMEVGAFMHGKAGQQKRSAAGSAGVGAGFAAFEAAAELVVTIGKQCGGWQPARTVSFVVKHPKTREIHAPDFADRVVHHLLVERLEKLYEPVFIHDSYANRAGRGSHAAVDRLQSFMRQRENMPSAHSDGGPCAGWYLQLDIHNFFNSIHRPTLYALLCKRLAVNQPARWQVLRQRAMRRFLTD